MSALPLLRVNPAIDIELLAACYRESGRVRIPSVLASGAAELYYRLEEEADWVQLISHETGAHEFHWNEWRDLIPSRRCEIEDEMFVRARDGFQYSYAALSIPGKPATHGEDLLDRIAEMMNDPGTLNMLEAVTGVNSPTFTDGQVTAYGEGDFLTGHDDDLADAGRRAAFVLGLTPQWRLEWGGLLLFHEPGTIDCTGLIPQFNTLDLFAVPKYHSVSLVTRAAARRRYSITGWLSVR